MVNQKGGADEPLEEKIVERFFAAGYGIEPAANVSEWLGRSGMFNFEEIRRVRDVKKNVDTLLQSMSVPKTILRISYGKYKDKSRKTKLAVKVLYVPTQQASYFPI